MSNKSYDQGKRDAETGKAARDVQNKHWKIRQDYNSGYAASQTKKS